jgi:hypothetical protein
MTLAPRVQVFTQLSCNRLHGGSHGWNHAQTLPPIAHDLHAFPLSLYTSIDPLGPHLHPSILFPTPPRNFTTTRTDRNNPRRNLSSRCRADPAVQAGAARLQTIMTTTMGLLSALTTGWWGHFGERHGRTTVLAIATFGFLVTCVSVSSANLDSISPVFLPVTSRSSSYPHPHLLYPNTGTTYSSSHPSSKVS